jgi:hypothetical protein
MKHMSGSIHHEQRRRLDIRHTQKARVRAEPGRGEDRAVDLAVTRLGAEGGVARSIFKASTLQRLTLMLPASPYGGSINVE